MRRRSRYQLGPALHHPPELGQDAELQGGGDQQDHGVHHHQVQKLPPGQGEDHHHAGGVIAQGEEQAAPVPQALEAHGGHQVLHDFRLGQPEAGVQGELLHVHEGIKEGAAGVGGEKLGQEGDAQQEKGGDQTGPPVAEEELPGVKFQLPAALGR